MSRRREKPKEYMREYREKNRDKINENARTWKSKNKEAMRDAKLRYRYGISSEEYNDILEAQNYRCAICRSKDVKRKNSKNFFVDHCHKNGSVRGLLCYKCNIGLSNFEDDVVFLERAKKYLINYKDCLNED